MKVHLAGFVASKSVVLHNLNVLTVSFESEESNYFHLKKNIGLLF